MDAEPAARSTRSGGGEAMKTGAGKFFRASPAGPRMEFGKPVKGCWFCANPRRAGREPTAPLVTEAAELGQIAAAARVGLKNSSAVDRAAMLLASAGIGTDRGLLDTHTMAGCNLQAHRDCLRRFYQDMGVVASVKGNGAHQSLTWEEANAACVEAARQLSAGASAMLWSVFAERLATDLFPEKAASAKVRSRWRLNIQDHIRVGYTGRADAAPDVLIVSHGQGAGERHYVVNGAGMGAAAAEIVRSTSRADDAEQMAQMALVFRQAGITDAQVLSQSALLLRSDASNAMVSSKASKQMATSAGTSLDTVAAAVGPLLSQFLHQLITGAHHTDADGDEAAPPTWCKAVLLAADVCYAITGQYTPKQTAIATFLRAFKTKNRVIDALADMGMCAYARHARELENEVAGDPAFGPEATIARYFALYGDDLMIHIVVDNCDHPIQGGMGLDIQYSHVNVEITLYRKSGLPLKHLDAPKEMVGRPNRNAHVMLRTPITLVTPGSRVGGFHLGRDCIVTVHNMRRRCGTHTKAEPAALISGMHHSCAVGRPLPPASLIVLRRCQRFERSTQERRVPSCGTKVQQTPCCSNADSRITCTWRGRATSTG